MGNKGVFWLIPALTGIGSWLATAGIGTLLTVFFGSFILSWLVWKILLPIFVLFGLICIGLVLLYFSAKDKEFSLPKAGIGFFCLMMAILVYLHFFAGYMILPGVFTFDNTITTMSVIGETTGTITTGITLNPVLSYVIIITTLYVIFRVVHKLIKLRRG